jgi:hypothetical protein
MLSRAPMLLWPVLAACAAPAGGDAPGPDACGASGLMHLVGEPKAALAAMPPLPDGPVRVIRPGMAITMDYSPTRLNIELDEAGRVALVFCG